MPLQQQQQQQQQLHDGHSKRSQLQLQQPHIMSSYSEARAVVAIAASLVLPIPLLTTINRYALHYPLDRLHYLLFQLVFFIMLPSIITAAGDTDFAHKLEVARKSGSRASSRQRSPSPHASRSSSSVSLQSSANGHAASVAGDVADQHKPHVHSEQCRKLESEFLRLAGQDSTAPDSPWTPLVSQTSPYPITVQGHKSKPFCFRITFYAPTLPGTAFDLLADILRRPDWDELMETTRIIEKLSPADNIHYVKMKPVWPTASRDSVMISHIASVPLNGTEKAAEAGDAKAVEYGYLNASQSIEDDRLPERTDEGIVRMVAGIAGQLVMMAPEEDKQRLGLEGANWCKVTQIADGDLKGWIPKSVIKFVATQALPRSITKVSKQLASMEHSMESQFIRNLSLPSAKVYTTAATSSSSPSPSSSPSRSSTNPASRTRKGNDGSALVRSNKAGWMLWLKVILRHAGPVVIASITSLLFNLLWQRRRK